jgi:cytochrome c-type biogenesis protein CcmF
VRAALGTFAITLGAVSALAGAVTSGAGVARRDASLIAYGRRCVWILLAASTLSVAAMEWALNTRDFSIAYVADNVARATPRLFTITALWGALEGSILLWGFVLSIFMGATAWRFRARAADPLVAWATIVQFAVALFFFALMLGPADPFQKSSGFVFDGSGPNALLQNHPLMAFHPPMLYAGYVGFTIPFSFAMAALATKRFGEGWLADTRRSTLVAWGFLTVGIVLGAWWSYEVLGWGGYWAWDPVENASLMPWLTATAFIHSVIVQERRAMLRVWNLSLVIATFSLTILGTFLTRSGVIDSVHAFSESDIGAWLLGFFFAVVIGGVGMIAWRGDSLRTPGRIDSPASREAAFLYNNLLFAGFALVVLVATVYPLLVEALRDKRLSVGEPYFRAMTTPIGIGLLFLMAVAPALPWRATSAEVLRDRLLVPSIAGVTTMLVVVVLGGEGLAQVIAFGLGAFCVVGILRNFSVATRTRRRASGDSIVRAGWRVFRGSPRLWGGMVVHIGVVIVAVAIAASAHYGTIVAVQLGVDDEVRVRDYSVRYLGSEETTTAQKTTTKARLHVSRGGRSLGVYAPAISGFPNARGAIGTPSVRTGLFEDLYLSLTNTENDRGNIGVEIRVNPLILWLWLGGGVMALGTLLCLLPKRREVVGVGREVSG